MTTAAVPRPPDLLGLFGTVHCTVFANGKTHLHLNNSKTFKLCPPAKASTAVNLHLVLRDPQEVHNFSTGSWDCVEAQHYTGYSLSPINNYSLSQGSV